MQEVHELAKPGAIRMFSDDGYCLSEAYVRNCLPDGEIKRIEGAGMREMVLCEWDTKRRTVYYWADRVTGTLYRAWDGRCMSSSRLRLAS